MPQMTAKPLGRGSPSPEAVNELRNSLGGDQADFFNLTI